MMKRVVDTRIRQRGRAAILSAFALGLAVAVASGVSNAQTAPQPRELGPGKLEIRPNDGSNPAPPAIKGPVLHDIEMLTREKHSWTPTQRKIKPSLLLEYKRRMGKPAFVTRVPGARVTIDADNTTLVDIKAKVTPEVLRHIEDLGGVIVNRHPKFNAIRARIPIERLEEIAASPDIRHIRPADQFYTRAGPPSEGVVAHRSDIANTQFGADGDGVKTCVVSDSVDQLVTLQNSGDLPANIDVLTGQSGNPGTSEGTAMLEIVFDMAPNAPLGFATGDGGEANMAQNIIDLRASGCAVIVDDIGYFEEPVFQDGPIAAAIDQVTADGALYFSAAGNGGNLNDGTSGVWEGDFVNSGFNLVIGGVSQGIMHSFGAGPTNPALPFSNLITGDPPFAIVLQWSDPFGGSGNDYDLYLVNGSFTTLLAASFDSQNGTDDPIELISGAGNQAGNRLVVVLFSGASRVLHLDTIRGRLERSTSGSISGHPAARGAIAVAAVDVDDAGGGTFLGSGANSVEFFSSDGDRRIFFEADGTPITPGNFSTSGGEVRQKPDIAAADGVSVASTGFNPFFGTSAAAPHAAGGAAQALSLDPAVSPDAVKDEMLNTAIDIEAPGNDRDSGRGIFDTVAMVQALNNRPDLLAEWVKLLPGCLASEANCRIKGKLAVANAGGGAAGASTARIYYSSDAILDPANDQLIKEFSVSGLAAGAVQLFPVKLPITDVTSIPANAVVYVVLDVTSAVAERNEQNNLQPDNGF